MSSSCKIGDRVGCSACNFGGSKVDGVFVHVLTSSQAINPMCIPCEQSLEKMLSATPQDEDSWDDDVSGNETDDVSNL